MAKRDSKGRVVAGGGSLNPGGRPPVPVEVREMMRAALPSAVRRLVTLVKSEDERVALSAIETLLVRVLGKAQNTGDGDEDGAVSARPLMGLTPAELVEIVKAGGH